MFCLQIWLLFVCAFILLNACEASNSEDKFSNLKKGKQLLSSTQKRANKVEISPNPIEIAKIAAKIAKKKAEEDEELLKKTEKIVPTTDKDKAEALFREVGTTLSKNDYNNLCHPRMERFRVSFCAWIGKVKKEFKESTRAVCVNHEIKTRSNPKENGKIILVLECQVLDYYDRAKTQEALYTYLVFNTPKKYHFYATNRLMTGLTGWTVHSIYYKNLNPETTIKISVPKSQFKSEKTKK